MAGRYSWNLNNVPRRPYPTVRPPQIACRICNHVFVSTQALIHHIESHMKDDDSSSSSSSRRRQQQPLVAAPATVACGGGVNLLPSQRNSNPLIIPPISSPLSGTILPIFNPNTITFPSFHERHPIFNPPQIVPPPRLAPPPPPYPPFMGVRNSNFTVASQQILFPLLQDAPKQAMEEANSDITKPFLQMLDQPFLYNDAEQNNSSDLDSIDLTLKL